MKKSNLSFLLILCIFSNACQRNVFTPPNLYTPPPPVVQGIHVTGLTTTNSSSIFLFLDSSMQLSATITPANASDPKLTYTSSNSSILIINNTGLMTGAGLGLATVTIGSADSPALKVTIQVAVVKKYAVYAVGYGPDVSYHEAMQWTDGAYTTFTSGGEGAYSATGIEPVGGDWYIAGMINNHDDWRIASYWKNGVLTQLSNPADEFNHSLTAVAISGQQVYIAGYNDRYIDNPAWGPGSQNVPVWNGLYYTINGNTATRTLLETDTNNILSIAYSIAVSGTDVYVSGGSQNGGYQNRVAAYWKNGQGGKVLLANASDWSEATGIALQGGNVYVAGYEQCSASYGCPPPMAKLWKNDAGTVINLSDPSLTGVASCLAVNDTAEFVGGNRTNTAGLKKAVLWRVNGNTVTTIPVGDDLTETGINGMTLSGNDVFLAGYQVDSVTHVRVAAYWRVYGNMVSPPVLLPKYYYAPSNHSEAYAIWVQ